MGFVRIQETMVDHFEQGKVVSEEWFTDVERLVELGAVVRVDPRDVPADAVQPPVPADEEPHKSIAEQMKALWPKDEPTEAVVVDPLGSIPVKAPVEPEPVVVEPEPVVEQVVEPAPAHRTRGDKSPA